MYYFREFCNSINLLSLLGLLFTATIEKFSISNDMVMSKKVWLLFFFWGVCLLGFFFGWLAVVVFLLFINLCKPSQLLKIVHPIPILIKSKLTDQNNHPQGILSFPISSYLLKKVRILRSRSYVSFLWGSHVTFCFKALIHLSNTMWSLPTLYSTIQCNRTMSKKLQ